MTEYDDREISLADGQPFELYEFYHDCGYIYRTTLAESVYDGVIEYTPCAISRSGLRQGESVPKDSTTLTLPRGDSLAVALLDQPPDAVTTLTIKRLHYGLLATNAIVVWKGRVTSIGVEREEAKITCESIYTSIKRMGLNAKFELNCVHALYFTGCGLNQLVYKVTGEVTAINNIVEITIPAASAYANGWFTGGMCVLNNVYRFITTHTGQVVTLVHQLPDLAVGDSVDIYPGCDHTLDTCINKFSNQLNFLGFPWMPELNPFETRVG